MGFMGMLFISLACQGLMDQPRSAQPYFGELRVEQAVLWERENIKCVETKFYRGERAVLISVEVTKDDSLLVSYSQRVVFRENILMRITWRQGSFLQSELRLPGHELATLEQYDLDNDSRVDVLMIISARREGRRIASEVVEAFVYGERGRLIPIGSEILNQMRRVVSEESQDGIELEDAVVLVELLKEGNVVEKLRRDQAAP